MFGVDLNCYNRGCYSESWVYLRLAVALCICCLGCYKILGLDFFGLVVLLVAGCLCCDVL